MKHLIFAIILGVGVTALGQTVNMPNGGTTTTCSGTFYDQGGAAGAYSNNSNRVHTICPTSGLKTRVTFTQFNTENGSDILEIFDGTTTGATSLGILTGNAVSLPFNAEATTANPSGCLTFRFTSNFFTTASGWASDISCFVPCQIITSNLVSSSPAVGAGGSIKVCQGQSINFVGSGTFGTSGTGATYTWDFGDGTTGTGTNVNHAYTTGGSYVVNLNITDPNGCTNSNALNLLVQVSTTPVINTSANPTSVCPGEAATLTGGVTMTPYVNTCASGVSQTVHLPDGTGVSYESPIAVDCYASNATIAAASDINNVCLNMEHSFSGDISIALRCPNGQQVTLKTNQGFGTNGNVFLGDPLDNSTTMPGTGRVYCFTPTATTLLNNAPTSPGGTPTGNSFVAGNYMPQQSFAGLVGCPLNGNWKIIVTDNLGADDGYVFSWDINFALPPLNPSFTPTVASQTWVANPELTGVTSTNATASALTPGSHCYTYSVTDNFGCTYTAPQCITVTPGITPTFNPIAAFCAGTTAPTLPGTSTNGISGTWSPATVSNTTSGTYTFTPNSGQCAVQATLNVTVNQPVTPAFSAVGPYCSGAAIPALPTTSTNGINGTWSPAINNTATTTYTFTPSAGACATTTTLTITITPNVTPTFSAVGPYCSGAAIPALPTTSTNGITGTWSPAINNTATTTYTFTPTAGVCATPTTLTITVNPNVTPTFGAVGPYCSGAAIPALPTTSTNGITGTWSPAINNTATTTYTFTPTAGLCATTTTLTITVNPTITPTFNTIPPYCVNDVPVTLSTTSNNGVTGTWSPSVINTSSAGSTNYTFTPSGGQCAAPVTITVVVGPPAAPTFAAVGPYCSGTAIPALPTTSTNGITGTWSPAINNTATTTYTFTPDAGLCATTTTLTITINSPVTPTFAPVGPYCSGATIPALPATSTNGITGTWSPAINNTATTTYTFTPTAGQCATTTTLTITIDPNVTPTFTPVGPYCSGAAIPALPTTSTNGITGTWSPAINNTATTTYTFTPTAGLCATTTTLTISIDAPVTPTFNPIPPYCVNDAPATLPSTSLNGISGTWSPSVINTSSAGSTNYTFTPNSGQCATPVTITVVVGPPATPTFSAVGPYCSGAAIPALPTTSTNGISGIWSPAINNTATTTYTFTPSAGLCATTTTLTITIDQPVTPTFAAVGPYCSGAAVPALPTTSTNGISGTWSPAINNTATTTYTFTPTSGQCATTTTLTITIDPNVTPTFGAVGPYCSGAAIPALPTTSTNGITGTWSPAINNTATTTYTFTPTAGLCATTTTLTIVIDAPVTPTFAAVGPYCSGTAIPALPTTSTNGISGTWSPAINNTATTTYTFTPNGGQCALTTTLTITIDQPVTPTFNPIPPYCVNDVPATLQTTSNNGITGTWSPSTINTSSASSTNYTFTPDGGQCASAVTITVVVGPPSAPTFNPVGPYCSGTTIAALPSTSTNGVPGTWSPAINNTATTTYTFTPDPGICATTTTLTITIDQPVTPTFAAVGPYCSGTVIPALPTTSTNGITGTWSPAINNTATTTYTFTPNGGQCATTTTLTIVIDQPVVPTFGALGPYCQGTIPGSLPAMSANGITGTWNPATISTATVGTSTYTFTPDGGQCATTATLSVTITAPNVVPTFTNPGPLCSGTSFTLPATSNEGVTGLWSPAVNNAATTTYTFTPDPGQCATTTTLTVTIDSPTTPTFGALGPYCQGTAAGTLSGTSLEGITGTWSPATISTATVGNTTYTFTPNGGQCATTGTLSVTITAPNVTPTFNTVPPQCQNTTAPALPTTSNNGVTGTWSPAVINTATAGTTTYTFTPNSGQCAVSVSINVTVGPPAAPTFETIPAFCENTTAPALPSTSLNGFNGTWSPAVVDNQNSGTYTFTPNSGQCATTTDISITVTQRVNSNVTQYPAYCAGSAIPALPTTSTNGIDGTWSPAINNTATTTYTFTPNSTECANPATMTITINQPITPTFAPLNAVCQNANAPALLSNSSNGISGTWSPATFSTATPGTFTATFTPNAGQCATTATLSLTVNALPIIAVNSPTTCANVPVQLNANGAVNYLWTPSAGLSAATGATVTATVSTNQTYTVIGTDANGCSSSAQATVTIAPGLTITVTPVAPTICLGESVTLNATGGTSYVWSPGATLNTTTGPTVIASPTGTTTYTVTGSDANGCTGTKNVTVTVNNPMPPVFSGSGSYCAGSSIAALPTNSNNGISGTWSPAINNAATTTYTFTPNAGQCASTGTLTIVINQPVPTVFAPLNPICQGGQAPSLPTTDLSGISGTWNPPVVNSQTSAVYTFTPNAGECALPGSVTSTILENPVASFNMSNPTPDVTFTDVDFFNTSTNADTYSWEFGDGAGSTLESPSHTFPGQVGTYTIVLTATNAAGCTDETMRIIEVKEDLFIYVPNTFTPDGDANNNTFYPVISGDFDPQNFTMLIFNRWGETMFETHDVNMGWDGTYQGMIAQEGVYTWRIDVKSKNNDNKKVFTGHISIMK